MGKSRRGNSTPQRVPGIRCFLCGSSCAGLETDLRSGGQRDGLGVCCQGEEILTYHDCRNVDDAFNLQILCNVVMYPFHRILVQQIPRPVKFFREKQRAAVAAASASTTL